MSVLYTNNAKTTLSASLNNSATSLSVASSSGFPSLSGSHYFYATLDDNTNLEVVKVTAVSGTTWTIVRAQDNTSATAFSSGDTIELRLNAALLTDVVNDALASSFTRQDFTGNGSTTAFTLNKTPGSESDLIVFIEGVFQNQADYTLSGTTLTFDEAPASSRKIVVYHVSASVSGDSLALNTFSGDGSTTAFTMSVDPLYENNTMVFIDGVYQNKSTYSTSGTTLTFDAAPANGTSIDVTTHTQQTINVPVDGSVSTAKIAADAVTGAKIADDAINSEHYTDGSIDTAHIANLQVTTGKLAADAVTATKLADDAVVTANITDDAVTTAKIADDQITLAKLAGLARGKIIYGDSSGNPAALALGSNGQVLKSDGTDIAWATDATVAALTSEEVQDIVGAMFSSNTETGITATYQDGDGTVDLVIGTLNQDTTGTAATVTGAAQTNITSLGTLTALTVDEITINADTITATDDFILDVEGEIVLDANNGGQVQLKDNGTEYGRFFQDSNRLFIQSMVGDADILIRGVDGSSTFTALSFDMSEAGAATFNSTVNGLTLASGGVTGPDSSNFTLNTANSFRLNIDSNDSGTGESFIVGHNQTAINQSNVLFKVQENGNVGIGTASPIRTLDIKDLASGDPGIRLESASYSMDVITLRNNDGRVGFGGDSITVRADGRVGVKTIPTEIFHIYSPAESYWALKVDCVNSAYGIQTVGQGNFAIGILNSSSNTYRGRWDHNGTLYSQDGNVHDVDSDERLKEDITDCPSQWSLIKDLPLQRFKWKDKRNGDTFSYGWVAQPTKIKYPEFVEPIPQPKEDIDEGKEDPEYLTVRSGDIQKRSIAALQEAMARIEALEAEVAALKG